jgi:hypothetical protein
VVDRDAKMVNFLSYYSNIVGFLTVPSHATGVLAALHTCIRVVVEMRARRWGLEFEV